MSVDMANASLDGSHLTGDPERLVPGTPLWDVGYPDHIQRYQFVAKRMIPGARVLDAGCGTGYGTALLADHGARLVVGADISVEALDAAKRHYNRERITWIEDDCHELAVASRYGPFDLIVNLENIEHLRHPSQFLSRAVDVLAPDGMLITSSPNRLMLNKMRGASPDAPPRNPYHVREYTAEEFESLLLAHFREVHLWYQCHAASTRARIALEPALRELWSNPALRVGRLVQRVARRRPIPRSLDELLPPPHGEWEILEFDPGADVTWTFIAVCRRPRETD